MFEPGVYKLYDRTLCAVCERDPTLVRLFGKNAFASTTFNVGSRTVTCEHYDHLNLAYGPCAITAIGKYNPKTSGHLILWDLRMIIEFPPMSTIIIPSAIVAHSNIPIREHERRYSMTQYSAAGLFRWIDCGFQSKKALEESGGQMPESGRKYWERGMATLSTWAEVQANLGRAM